MLDFLKIGTREGKKDTLEIYPIFKVQKTKDLMIRGGDFYAVWIEERNLWSTDEDDVVRLVDKELWDYADKVADKPENANKTIVVKCMLNSDTGSIEQWHRYCQKHMRDNFVMLDEQLIFSNSDLKKESYASKKLNYPLEPGDISAWDKLVSTLYSEEERHKIEWAIGSIVTGDSKELQKFMVLYGAAGTGKSTILNIIQQLFEGYYAVFDAKALGSANSSFALEPFRANPLVAIQHDGDLSKIEDNTRLNSLVSHELMTVNEKFKTAYSNRFKAFLFMGTNKPVKITDGKSGLLRRLIDVHPTGKKLGIREYKALTKQVTFELGAIACHCRDVYLADPNYYDTYLPRDMMGASNDFYNYVMDSYSVFKKDDGTTLKAAWERYKTYCEEARVPYPLQMRNFREELKNYFWNFEEEALDKDGKTVRNLYSGFRTDIFEVEKKGRKKKESVKTLELKEGIKSIFDEDCADCLAQYANKEETPSKAWDDVKTTLKDIDTSKIHYVRPPENHIVIDFDLKDENGNKSLERNLRAAAEWPPTYAEVSKGGNGLHLHYIYNGDVTRLSRLYSTDIEIKVFTGKSSLRRRLSKCNDLPIATFSGVLPLKEEKKVIGDQIIKSEKSLREQIARNLNKEIHGATAPSVSFIKKILDDAYDSGLGYDVSDMKNEILAFAAQSSHQADKCIKLVSEMKFKSKEPSEAVDDEAPIIFYDVEVFPNLFLVNWKFRGKENKVIRMINPDSKDIEDLLKYRLVGFNCRRYDNHIMYARLMGYTNEELYNLSQKIINSPKGEQNKAFFSEAYNLSYTDVYDFAAKKQSLKKWEIELGIHHKELGLPWDQPVPKELWPKVAEYCDNDVIATEAVFDHLEGDFTARKILADLAGMSVNDTTNSLTTRIVFGKERNPQLVYTDLATGEQHGDILEDGPKHLNAFPGYEFVEFGDDGKSHNIYRGTDIGFGGYIISNPGIYHNVALLDVASLHPNSIRAMNCFGKYTKNFTDILDARIAIKHKDFDTARKMLDGRLAPYLKDESEAKQLAQALKIAINSVYGLTSANFSNPFRDSRNKNNIVALRGALFMRTLQDEVESRGFKIVAIKTDSIKIADATQEIIDFCMDFAKKYSYTFEHEATYDCICQINDADYIARYKDSGEWTVTGAKFAVPYVFKTLFSKEPVIFDDLCETFSVKSALYLDMNEKLPDVTLEEKELDKVESKYKKGLLSDTTYESEYRRLKPLIEKGHDYKFVGKVGRFSPIKPGMGGGLLMREQNGKYYAATGTTGYRWLESEILDGDISIIDESYYRALVDDAVETISQYGDFEAFVNGEENPPWNE